MLLMMLLLRLELLLLLLLLLLRLLLQHLLLWRTFAQNLFAHEHTEAHSHINKTTTLHSGCRLPNADKQQQTKRRRAERFHSRLKRASCDKNFVCCNSAIIIYPILLATEIVVTFLLVIILFSIYTANVFTFCLLLHRCCSSTCGRCTYHCIFMAI